MITTYKLYEMKNTDAQIEFYKKFSDPKTYNEIKKFIDTEILPYCNNKDIINLYNDFKNFKSYNTTTVKNLKTSSFNCSFTPSKYYDKDNEGYGANFYFFIVEDKNTKKIIDSYFESKIYGYSYAQRSGKDSAKFQTSITNPELKELLNLSKLSQDDKCEIYIDKIDINILKNIIKKIGIDNFDPDLKTATESEIREELKQWLYEDEMISDPLNRSILYQAKKLGILI